MGIESAPNVKTSMNLHLSGSEKNEIVQIEAVFCHGLLRLNHWCQGYRSARRMLAA